MTISWDEERRAKWQKDAQAKKKERDVSMCEKMSRDSLEKEYERRYSLMWGAPSADRLSNADLKKAIIDGIGSIIHIPNDAVL